MENKSIFNELSSIDVNRFKEEKNGLSYLSWAYAWQEVKKRYPDANYMIHKNEDNLPFFEDADMGLMVYTEVTINGETMEMWLPVMDSANNAMRRTERTYLVYSRHDKKWVEKRVEPATMFDVNKTVMRCLTKNLAMFGLGLYIYAGEDLPEALTEAPVQKEVKELDVQDMVALIDKCNTRGAITQLIAENPQIKDNKTLQTYVNNRWKQLPKE